MGRSSRPLDKGGRSPKKFFSVLRASVWSRNKGIRHWYFLKLPKRNGANRLISNRNFQFSHVNSKHPWAHTPLILSSSLDALNTEPLEDLQWAESKCETLVLGFLLPFRIISCLSEDTIMTLTRSFICIHLCGNTVSEMLTRNSVGSRTWDKKGGGGGGVYCQRTLTIRTILGIFLVACVQFMFYIALLFCGFQIPCEPLHKGINIST